MKEQCCSQPVLKYFDIKKPVEIRDASQHGLSAVLIQEGQPIAYTSRSLTDVEGCCGKIEKEMLSIVHACKSSILTSLARSDRVQQSQAPLTDSEETTCGSTNAATENDTKPSAV